MNDELEQRLGVRFAAAIAAAERDYPGLRIDAATPPRSPRVGTRTVRRLGVVAGLGLVTILATGGLAVLSRPSEPAVPGTSSAGSIPPIIDGERVYSLAEMPQMNGTGTFLLRAYAQEVPVPCASPIETPSIAADRDLVPECGTISLVPKAADNDTIYFNLAPRSRGLLLPFLGGSEVVMRVHAHDPEAAQCSAVFIARCEGALVIDAVVWPDYPQASDQPMPVSTGVARITALPSAAPSPDFTVTGNASLQGDPRPEARACTHFLRARPCHRARAVRAALRCGCQRARSLPARPRPPGSS
jgi:hypothetical protein